MDVEDVLPAEVILQLPDRLEKWKALYVAHCSADFDHHHIRLRVFGGAKDLFLDHVGHVWDHLHGGPEVVAATLAGDHVLIDLSGRDVGRDGQVLVDEPLVVAEVEVRFRAVIGDEHLAVLVGAHRPGVDVEIGVELLEGDGEVAGLQDVPDRRRRDALAKGGDDTPGHENVLRHRRPPGRFFRCYRRREAAKPLVPLSAPEPRPWSRTPSPTTSAPQAWAAAPPR